MNIHQVQLDSPSVIAHINAMQAVIQRMADNSRSCKLWCVPLVSAVLLLVVGLSSGAYALLALAPTLALGFLDAYYLSLEKGFREAYNQFVDRLHHGALDPSEVFVIAPVGVPSSLYWKSLLSPSVWLFYPAFILIAAVVWLAPILGG